LVRARRDAIVWLRKALFQNARYGRRVPLPLRELPYLDGAAHAQGRLIPTQKAAGVE
jgi:hypothetical protein